MIKQEKFDLLPNSGFSTHEAMATEVSDLFDAINRLFMLKNKNPESYCFYQTANYQADKRLGLNKADHPNNWSKPLQEPIKFSSPTNHINFRYRVAVFTVKTGFYLPSKPLTIAQFINAYGKGGLNLIMKQDLDKYPERQTVYPFMHDED